MEDWFQQMSNPRKIKNLLTYLLKALIRCTVTVSLFSHMQKAGFLITRLNYSQIT